MSKQHAQKNAEQTKSRTQGMNSSRQEKRFYQANQLKNSASVPGDFVMDPEAGRLRAYQIHEEKGGTAEDNWLEAERILREESQKKRSEDGLPQKTTRFSGVGSNRFSKNINS